MRLSCTSVSPAINPSLLLQNTSGVGDGIPSSVQGRWLLRRILDKILWSWGKLVTEYEKYSVPSVAIIQLCNMFIQNSSHSYIVCSLLSMKNSKAVNVKWHRALCTLARNFFLQCPQRRCFGMDSMMWSWWSNLTSGSTLFVWGIHLMTLVDFHVSASRHLQYTEWTPKGPDYLFCKFLCHDTAAKHCLQLRWSEMKIEATTTFSSIDVWTKHKNLYRRAYRWGIRCMLTTNIPGWPK